ncbi:sulfurtransferase TusA family protein [Bacillus marinisedimentorum]|uniref:sulfurtransferase TusA family protein n=1 Tax=Bacillus marinisedimentorum TaxID=1821260 RepID=UPI0008721B5E|nr:sulfurtransferase TusA family protein [Bacillus marinisedimentorum]
METVNIVDAKGLACPMPIVKTKKAMDKLQQGDILEIQATDKGATNDLTAWSKSSGHEMLEMKDEDGILTFWIKKG